MCACSDVLYQCFVYGYHVSALLHCIGVLYKCYVFLLRYITALLTLCFCVVVCFFGRTRLQYSLKGGGGPFVYQNFTCLQPFLQMVRITIIFMWLWLIARQPNSSMLSSITSAIPQTMVAKDTCMINGKKLQEFGRERVNICFGYLKKL